MTLTGQLRHCWSYVGTDPAQTFRHATVIVKHGWHEYKFCTANAWLASRATQLEKHEVEVLYDVTNTPGYDGEVMGIEDIARVAS